MARLTDILAALLWLPAGALKLALALLGLVTVPIALAFDTWPRLLWLWGNDEEGVPVWWLYAAKDKRGPANWWPRFFWYAIRNPVNNLRFAIEDRTPDVLRTNWHNGKPMEARELIEADMVGAYRYVRAGLLSGYRQVWLTGPGRYSEVWFGWKLGSSVPGLGFTAQTRLPTEGVECDHKYRPYHDGAERCTDCYDIRMPPTEHSTRHDRRRFRLLRRLPRR